MQSDAFERLSIAIFPQRSGIPLAIHAADLFGDPVALLDGVEIRLPDINNIDPLLGAIIDVLLCVLGEKESLRLHSRGGGMEGILLRAAAYLTREQAGVHVRVLCISFAAQRPPASDQSAIGERLCIFDARYVPNPTIEVPELFHDSGADEVWREDFVRVFGPFRPP